MSKKCAVCGKPSEQYLCKKHNANKGLIHRFRQLDNDNQEKTIETKKYETKLLVKSHENPALSIAEVIKVVEKR